MAKTAQPTSDEPEVREPPELPRPSEHVHVYVAPGMNTISFAELMLGFGVRRDLNDWMEGITGQLATLTNNLAELAARLDELQQRSAAPTTGARDVHPTPRRT